MEANVLSHPARRTRLFSLKRVDGRTSKSSRMKRKWGSPGDLFHTEGKSEGSSEVRSWVWTWKVYDVQKASPQTFRIWCLWIFFFFKHSGFILLLLALIWSTQWSRGRDVLSRETRTPQGPAWLSVWDVQSSCYWFRLASRVRPSTYTCSSTKNLTSENVPFPSSPW